MYLSLKGSLGHTPITDRVGEGPLQIAEGAAAAYSLRNLGSDSPSVVRVRRESDNNERDFTAQDISTSVLTNWVNEQITPPLDLRELTATGRDGPIIEAAAAYSLRNLSDSYAGDVVEVRRNTDGALKDFKASEVTDGTLEAWVNTSFANALPLDTSGAAAAAYSLRSLGTNQWSYGGDTVTYTSDFSAGVDGWSADSGSSVTTTPDPVGTLDVLKYTIDTEATPKWANLTALTTGQQYTVQAQVYVPSSNVGLDSIVLMDGTGGMATSYLGIQRDQWVTVSTASTAAFYSINIRGASGTTASAYNGFQGNGTDVFYVRNVVISETLGDSNYLPAGKYVTQVRRSSDDAVRSFTAAEVTDGTLEAWVNEDVADLIGNARYFNGTSTYVDVGASLITAYPFEFTATIATTESSGVMGVVSTGSTNSSAKYGIELIDGFPILRGQTSTTGGQQITGGTSVADGANHTIRAVFTSNTSRELFVDGVSVGTDATNLALQGSGNVNIGRQLDSSPSNYFSGIITSVDVNGVAAYTGLGTSVTAWEDTIGSNDGTESNGATFTGQGYDGFVSKWYDQSGNDNHATQGTPASQPKIVSGGSLVTGGLDFDGVNDFFQASIGTLTQPISGFSVFKNNSLLNAPTIWDSTSPTNRVISFAVASDDTFRIFAGTGVLSASSSQVDGTTYLRSDLINTTASEGYVNGTLKMSGNPGTNSMEGLTIGARYDGSVNFTNGSIAEIIIYNSDQSDKRRAIEENIGSTYGITLTSSKDGTVSKWYDQSTTSGVPNANHAVQTDAASQPKIVDAGALVTGGLDFDGVNDNLQYNYAITNPTSGSIFSVFNNTATSYTGVVFGIRSGTRDLIQLTSQDENESVIQVRDSGNVLVNAVASSPSRLNTNLSSAIFNKATPIYDINVNGGQFSGSSSTVLTGGITASKATIGGTDTGTSVSAVLTGTIQEIIYYNSDQSDNRTALEANIGEVYGIAGIPAYDNTVNGFVETWYDQSGNGKNATQLTASDQPKIVDGGSLVVGGLAFDGTDFFNTSLVPPSAATLIGVATWGVGGGMIVGARDSTDERSYISRTSSTSSLILGVGGNNLASELITIGDESLAFAAYSGTTANVSLNGVNTSFNGQNPPVNTTYGYRIGTLNSFGTNIATMTGRIREVIIYDSDQSANRPAIEANINNQYDIY